MRPRTRVPVAKKPTATKKVGRGGNAPKRRGGPKLIRPGSLSTRPKGPPKPPGLKGGGVIKKRKRT